MALTNDKPTAAKKIACDNCDNEDEAQSRCNECAIFLCQFCTDSHKQYRSTKPHKLLTMKELKSSAGPQNIAEKIKCPKHKEEVIKLFCKTCQTTICRDCTIVDHRQHDYGFVEEVAEKEKQRLERNLNEVKQRKSRVVQGITNLKKFNQLLEAKRKSTISEIDKHFDKLAKAVEYRKKQTVEKATSLTNSKQKQINAQLEVLEVALATCESSIEFTERAFKNGNDVQILSMEKYILQSLEQLKTVRDQTEPCVTEDLMFMIPSSVKETKTKLLNAYDVHISVASPGSGQASFNEAEQVFNAGKQYSITLVCHDKNNGRLTHGGQDIKPSFSGMKVSDVAVIDNKDGSYVISFCPRQDGMLEFEVSIDGMPARNCSLTKQVKWVEGMISTGGKKLNGDVRDGEYCCRVGGCYFESGFHTWEVELFANCTNFYFAEVGVIDYDKVNADIAKSKSKWVYKCKFPDVNRVIASLTLDMGRKTLNITSANPYDDTTITSRNYQLAARRVSPFFACNSPNVRLSIVN